MCSGSGHWKARAPHALPSGKRVFGGRRSGAGSVSVVYDHDRHRRICLPEAVLCEGKPVDAIIEIADELSNPSPQPLLLTRLSKEKHAQLPQRIKDQLDFHPLSRTAYLNGRTSNVWPAKIAVVSAGTSDLAVAWEAAR